MPSSRGCFQPRDRTQVSALQVDYLPYEPPGKPKNTGVGSLSLLQGIFPTQELNQHLLQADSLPTTREALYIGWINNKVLLYSTGNYIQYPGETEWKRI